MTDLVHTFQGRPLAVGDVPFARYSDLLEARRSNSSIHLSFYSKGRKQVDVSFAEFHRATLYRATMLADSGHVRRGSPAVVLLGNSLDAFVTYSALLLLGAVVTPIDPAETVAYVERVAKIAGATVAIGTREWAARLDSTSLPCLHDFSIETESAHREFDGKHSVSISDAATLFFTSGTTGDAKGVLQTFGAAMANAEGTRRAGLIDSSDVLSTCLPLYHVNAFNFAFLLPLVLGSRVVYADGFTPVLWKILRDEASTVASLSPPVIRLMLKDSRSFERSASLRYAISASSALHHADVSGMKEKYGVRVCQAYGLSETINFTLFTPPDLPDDAFREIASSGTLPPAGLPVWGQDVAIVDESGKTIESDSTSGEVVVRGWNVLREYLNNPNATRTAFRDDWFHTGDLAYVKTRGDRRFFYLCGRIKETAKRLGVQIYLSEIDQTARDVGLESACAVAFGNEHTDEEIGLYFVRPDGDGRSQEEILSLFKPHLPFAKRPKIVVEGTEIPRTSVGKIKRGELRKEFAKHAGTRFQDR